MPVASPTKPAVPPSAKQPTDHQVKTSALEEVEDFVFEWPKDSGTTFAVPPQGTMKSGVLRRNRAKVGIDFIYSVMEDVWPAEAVAATDEMSQDELIEVFGAWQKHSGVSLGE